MNVRFHSGVTTIEVDSSELALIVADMMQVNKEFPSERRKEIITKILEAK